MISKINEKMNIILRLILMSFPVFIILGPFALNCFSLIFSLYAIINFKKFKKFKIFNEKIIIFFFSFIILIFPFESIDFDNAFLYYLSFFRFVLMLFGIIIFIDKENKKNNILFKIYKSYVLILTVILIDVLVEYFSGYNLLGYSSEYIGRIASFTNDELIIGYISSFLILFTLGFILKKTNNFYFFVIISVFIIISFLIGERSNFIKLLILSITSILILFICSNKFKTKNLLIIVPLILVLLIAFIETTKNTKPGKKLYNTFDNLIVKDNNKISLNLKEEFYNSRHAYHYITAYKIFLEYPVFGIGINNFFLESSKEKYMIKGYGPASNHPHQIYLEIISEVGLTGLIYFVFIFFYPVYLSIKSFRKNKELILLSHLVLHIFFIFPVLPTGSLFGTNYGIPFWFNLSILLYLCNNKSKT
mgnify:FL=1